jgi:hypothetical protein
MLNKDTSEQMNKIMTGAISCNVTPCSVVQVYQHFWGTYCPHHQGQRVSQASSKLSNFACSAYSFTLKMETVSSSETLLNLYQTTWCHIPDDTTRNQDDHIYQNTHIILFGTS